MKVPNCPESVALNFLRTQWRLSAWAMEQCVIGVACVTAWIVSAPWTALAQDTAGPRNWSWGSGDEQGAGNLITPQSILEALSLVSQGEVIELSHEVVAGAPLIPGLQPPYGFRIHLTTGTSVPMFAQDMGLVGR